MDGWTIETVEHYYAALGYIIVVSAGKIIELRKEDAEMIDNYDLYQMHEVEAEIFLDELPVCDVCGQPIMQDKAIYYNDQWFCEHCEDEAWALIKGDYLESTTD